MKSVRSTARIIPSLLDRLIDDEPGSAIETPKSQQEQIHSIKENVRRDLENLLNTRLKHEVDTLQYPELKTSLVNYGLQDFSQIPVESDSDQMLFAAKIQDIIKRFEPRFKNVRVDVVKNGENYQRTLYVKITATLLLEPDSIPVIYDSRVRHIDKSLKLRELKYG